MKSTVLIVVLLMLGILCHAQKPSLYFGRITTEKGLSNNQVNCIIQDKRGFIWIGTNDGLNRYDGNHFIIFRNTPGDSTSLPGNMINDILEDEDGVLWIATGDGGLGRYDYRQPVNRQFRQFKHLPADTNSIPTNGINKLVEDKQGFLWLASNGYSVIRFHKKTGSFDRPVSGGPRTALSLAFDHAGKIWVGREGGGILKIDPVNRKYESDPRYQDLYARLPHVVVTSLYRDSENKMWYGSWDRVLYSYDPVTGRESTYQTDKSPGSFVNDDINDFVEDGRGRIWIGGKTKGLQVFDRGTGKFYNYQYDPAREGTVADNNIRCVFIDRDGKIWLGTTKGISVNDPAQQQFSQTFLPDPPGFTGEMAIYDFYEDENNDLWIGTSAGIYLKRNNSSSFIYKPLAYKETPLAVSKFYMDSKGVFYIGTNYSVFIYDRINHSVRLLPNTEQDQVMNKIISSRVVSIAEDSIGGNRVLVVSPYGHFLAYYDFAAEQWVSRRDTTRNIITAFNLMDNLVRKIYRSGTGQVWMATAKYGLGKWVNNSSPRLEFFLNDPFKKESLSNNHVYDIAEDASHNLYFSTYGGGLHFMRAGTDVITHLPATNNLLEGILPDGKGNVWMITNGNLQRYNVRSKSSSFFYLPDLEKTGGVRGYIFRDKKGLMYLAGKNYFISIHPDSISDLRRQPEIYLTDFRIFNESFNSLIADSTIRLGYRQNYFTVEFSAPEFSPGGPVQYSYMLEGWDKDWVNIGTRNFVTFSNLDGGHYRFRVRATNYPGTWSDREQQLVIRIIPPFWKRWWFFALCAVLIALATYSVYKYRLNELVKRQAIRNKIAQDLHDSVGSTLSSISVYSQVARIYKQKNQDAELQDTLEKIGDTSGEMISEMNDIVWAINPRNDNMEKIFHRMESFARPLLQAKGISIRFDYDPSLLQVNLPMEKRKNFYLIFKESVNNILKYADCRNMNVSISLKQQQIELLVTDDGGGFDMVKVMANASRSLSGNGLNNMKRRAMEMKGQLTIESSPGQGTIVKLRFPVT